MGQPKQPDQMKWWQVALLIVISPLTLTLFLIVAIVGLPISLVGIAIHKRRERRIEEFLGARNRIANWSDVKPRAASGEGTVIQETWFPKGPYREWWTEDDLASLLDDDTPAWRNCARSYQRQKLTHRAAEIAKDYTHVELGKARLIDRSSGRGKYPQRIRDECPKASVITIVQSGFDPVPIPMLFAGDFLDANRAMIEFDAGGDSPQRGDGL